MFKKKSRFVALLGLVAECAFLVGRSELWLPSS